MNNPRVSRSTLLHKHSCNIIEKLHSTFESADEIFMLSTSYIFDLFRKYRKDHYDVLCANS